MAALAGEMPGSIPDPEAVTASGGICESLTWSNASICFCRVWMSLTSTGLVGPRLDAEEYSPSQPGSVLTAGFVAELTPLADRFAAGSLEAADLNLASTAYLGIRRALTSLGRNDESRRYAELAVRYSRRYAEAARTPEAYLHYASASRSYASFLRSAGQLEQALAALNEALHTVETLPESKRQQSELSADLYYIGSDNGDSDSLGLNRPAVAILALERSVAVSRKLMAADRNDHNARVDFVQADIRLADLLRPSNPARALRVFDEAWDVMRAEPEGSFLRAEYLIRTAAEASYALRDLGKSAEARRRLAQVQATFHIDQTPGNMQVTPHGAEEEWVRAEADLDAAAGNPRKAITVYVLILGKFDALGYRPHHSLTDALALSVRQARLAELYRQAGDDGMASRYAADRRALWRGWNASLPNNPVVLHQLAEAQ